MSSGSLFKHFYNLVLHFGTWNKPETINSGSWLDIFLKWKYTLEAGRRILSFFSMIFGCSTQLMKWLQNGYYLVLLITDLWFECWNEVVFEDILAAHAHGQHE